MYLVREIFVAKPGQAGKLAKMFKKMSDGMPNKSRVMTDMVGPYNTVVMEMEINSLAEWEKEMMEMRSGKLDTNMDPKLAEEMKNYTEMYTRGRREIYELLD